ncbi:unnamed protein product [Caenorhabditis bovis]|uniref:Cyclin N-terminal domain-containing protein n=1 Tax=Caenorhabditis bovis TaxID=2654633 RepID=A0A8S1EQU5_9PELO|nr:unnamed protein product [Caenorhabditis bovis]
MFQLDSWYSVLFEVMIVGFSLYNSLRMTRWWETVRAGAVAATIGNRAPSVEKLYGLDKNNNTKNNNNIKNEDNVKTSLSSFDLDDTSTTAATFESEQLEDQFAFLDGYVPPPAKRVKLSIKDINEIATSKNNFTVYKFSPISERSEETTSTITNESPCAKNASADVTLISEGDIEEVNNPASSNTTKFIPNTPSNNSLSVIKECSFLLDFHTNVADMKEKLSKVFCSDLDIFEMYHIARNRDHDDPIRVPASLLMKETGVAHLEDCRVSDDDLERNCSAADRRRVLLDLIAKRRGLRITEHTIHLAAAILDKCLQMFLVETATLQQLAVISFVVASKLEEIDCLSIRDAIVCNLITGIEIKSLCRLERFVLKALSYRVNYSTPLTFANFMLVFLNAKNSVINMTHYILELGLLHVALRAYYSPEVAHAAVCLAFALDKMNPRDSCKCLSEAERRLNRLTEIEPGATRRIMNVLVEQYELASNEKHEIYVEYERVERDSVSLRTIDKSLKREVSRRNEPTRE